MSLSMIRECVLLCSFALQWRQSECSGFSQSGRRQISWCTRCYRILRGIHLFVEHTRTLYIYPNRQDGLLKDSTGRIEFSISKFQHGTKPLQNNRGDVEIVERLKSSTSRTVPLT